MNAAVATFDGVKLLDLKWNPHRSNVLAFSGTGGSVQIWRVDGDDSAQQQQQQRQLCLTKTAHLQHTKDVHLVDWHPTTNDYLLSISSPDHKVVLWSADGRQVWQLAHPDLVGGISWSADGNSLTTTCRDGFVRFFVDGDLRWTSDSAAEAVAARQFRPHAAAYKLCQATILKDGRVFTSGSTKSSMREIALWEVSMTSTSSSFESSSVSATSSSVSSTSSSVSSEEPLFRMTVDHGIGCFRHLYDSELNLVYLMAKGEPGFRVFEITDAKPFVHFLTRHVSTTSAAASSFGSSADFMAALPAAALDGDNCEIQRLVRLDVARKRLEHISVRVPRRYPQSFKTDLYHRCGNQTPLLRPTPRLGDILDEHAAYDAPVTVDGPAELFARLSRRS